MEQFPFQWKTTWILPHHKKGFCYDILNYRSIAWHPSLSKVFEKPFHRRLYSYFESNNLLNHLNFGFRSNHSMVTSLSKTSHDIYLVHVHKLFSRVVFLHISTAFDRVVHSSVLFKVKQMNNVGSLLTLRTSYLIKQISSGWNQSQHLLNLLLWYTPRFLIGPLSFSCVYLTIFLTTFNPLTTAICPDLLAHNSLAIVEVETCSNPLKTQKM